MKKTYINGSHRKYSEACQKEVAEMSRQPLSVEQKEAQMEKNIQTSLNRAAQRRQEASATFAAMRADVAKADIQGMTVDEINAEIEDVRNRRRG